MGVIKKKPYEISIWEDRLVNENGNEYYKEIKIAVIGSDKMESPNRAFDPVLTENVNGEKTLTFSIAYKYFDDFKGEIVNNPFYPYLINERKVKLLYNDEWFEFLIKECDETSEDYIFKYTAKELFSLELSKLGYEVTLDNSLNNNQGTIIELAEKVLENTDWIVDKENSDLLVQKIQEPLYEAKLLTDITALNLDNYELEVIPADETIYIFYSYINNHTKSFVQFICEKDRNNYEYDDDNIITATNYRLQSDVEYVIVNNEVTAIKNIASIQSLYLSNQAYRLAYNIRTTYDPVMQRTVDMYKVEYGDSIQDIYHYLDYNYTTSDIVTSYITNGSSFNTLSDGSLQGWDNDTVTSASQGIPVLQPIDLVTYPEISSSNPLALFKDMSEINGYLELKFNNVLNSQYENIYFNSGFENNSSIIDHISAGEKFVLRMRYYTSLNKHGDLIPGAPSTENQGIRVIVAKYETIEKQCYLNEKTKQQEIEDKQEAQQAGEDPSKIDYSTKLTVKKILPNEIVLDFNGNFQLSQNIIDNGVFNDTHSQYLVSNVVQAPSTAYVYITKEDSTQYVWHPKMQRYIEKGLTEQEFRELYPEYTDYDNVVFADYYYTIAAAQRSFSNEILSDPKFKLGVFLYTKDSNLVNKYIYLQDIQLTRYYSTTNEEGIDSPVIIGNVPTAISSETNHYYLKPTEGMKEKEVSTYDSLKFLATELGVNEDSIVPVYNDNSEKILSIQAANSNYFNILQDLCETFECWLDIQVKHNKDGSITLDNNNNPIKKVAFKNYAGKDNFAGFKKGINLSNINRQIDSNEIVTKLIVDPVQSDVSETGSIDIQSAPSNPSGQSYIINFSYFLNRGLITDVEACNNDLLTYYAQLHQYNEDITKQQKEFIYLENSITKITANRNVYTTLIDKAKDDYNEAIQKFYDLTDWSYEAFVTEYQNIDEWARREEDKAKNYLEDSTVLDTIGEIYVSTAAVNNYTGLLTNLDEEYRILDLKCYGAKEYGVSVVSVPGVEEESINPSTQITIDNYTTDIQFKLIDANGGEVVFHSSPNDRIFNVSNALPYEYIVFSQIPENYKLKYFINNQAQEIDAHTASITRFPIYDYVENQAINKRFIIIPNPEYAEEYLGYKKRIDLLIEEKKKIEKNFYKKYSRFLQEGTWSSQDYIDAELYYLDALQVSNTSAQPKVSYTIDVLEVSQLDGLQNYDFRVGDKTYIEDTDFFGYGIQAVPQSNGLGPLMVRSPIREEVIVSEVEWHLDEPDTNTITIQNYKTRFEDLFQRISATVQTVQRNEITYPKTSTILDQSGLINSTLLTNSLEGIGGLGFALTTNGSVSATDDGLIIRNLINPANVMKLESTGLLVSTDGGDKWSTAISAEGISTDILTAGTINTQKIWLMDGDNPSFRWDKSGLNAYGLDKYGRPIYDLKTYVRFDKYGLYGIKNDENYVATSLDDVRSKAFFGVTWDGFFIKNSYTNDGEVSITSEEDFVVRKGNIKRIHIGAVEFDDDGAPSKYGIKIRNDEGNTVFETGDDGNITVSGTINALAGQFTGKVTVGNPNNTHILIDGSADNPIIQSSNYSDGAGTGWIIDSNGDATFSNVSVRGAIKTAVFEYEEIQAVGGAFLFRPSSTIKNVRYEPSTVTVINEDNISEEIETYYHYENGVKVYNDLLVTVEQPLMFREGNWVKISNYNTMGADPAIDNAAALSTYGLVHIYEIGNINVPTETTPSGEDEPVEPIDEETIDLAYEFTLVGGCAVLDDIGIENIPGGALIDFGNHRQEGGIDVPGTQNYGIGINSSDNYVNLPAHAISLFETIIHPNNTTKVTYNYRGILGTLPELPYTGNNAIVNQLYHNYMKGTQGIYTDNMYIGDASRFLAFYTENGIRKLRIKASDIIFEGTDGSEIDTKDSMIEVKITSSNGNIFKNGQGSTILTCTVLQGNNDITNNVSSYVWKKDGVVISGETTRTLEVLATDVNSTAVYTCDVTFD